LKRKTKGLPVLCNSASPSAAAAAAADLLCFTDAEEEYRC